MRDYVNTWLYRSVWRSVTRDDYDSMVYEFLKMIFYNENFACFLAFRSALLSSC